MLCAGFFFLLVIPKPDISALCRTARELGVALQFKAEVSDDRKRIC